MDVIDIDDDTIDAGVLDSMAVTQVCPARARAGVACVMEAHEPHVYRSTSSMH